MHRARHALGQFVQRSALLEAGGHAHVGRAGAAGERVRGDVQAPRVDVEPDGFDDRVAQRRLGRDRVGRGRVRRHRWRRAGVLDQAEKGDEARLERGEQGLHARARHPDLVFVQQDVVRVGVGGVDESGALLGHGERFAERRRKQRKIVRRPRRRPRGVGPRFELGFGAHEGSGEGGRAAVVAGREADGGRLPLVQAGRRVTRQLLQSRAERGIRLPGVDDSGQGRFLRRAQRRSRVAGGQHRHLVPP